MATRVTISAEIPVALNERLDRLVEATQRSRSTLVTEALRRLVEEEEPHVAAIRAALDDYRSGTSESIPHEQVMREMAELLGRLPGQNEK